MASNTPRLNLYKKDPVADANTTFNITTMLNDNWDRIDQNVALQSDLHTHANKTVLDKFSEGADGKPLYNGQKITDETTVQGMQKEIANLNLQLEASQRVPNGYTFGTDFLNTFGMTIDYTKTTAIGALTIGTTTIPVQDVTGFQVGQEVTIYDDVNLERVTISAIDTTNKTLTVSSLTKSYKNGASVARTMAVVDTINKCLKFGNGTSIVNETITNSEVAPSPFDTSGTGRKLIRTSNGNLFAAMRSKLDTTTNTNDIYIYKSTNNGINWSFLVKITEPRIYDVALATNGTYIYIFYTYSSNSGTNPCGVKFCRYDQNGTLLGSIATIYQTLDEAKNCSLAINNTKTEIHAAWSCSTGSEVGLNIRYVKGTINGDGSVTWGGVSLMTIDGGNINNNYDYPFIVINSNNNPVLLYSYPCSSHYSNYIYSRVWNGSSWSGENTVYYDSYYSQGGTSACVDKNGRIWAAWSGRDSTNTTASNIRVSYSDDGGSTWTAMQKLTIENTLDQDRPTITINNNNKVFILWAGKSDADTYQVKQISYDGTSWSPIQTVTQMSSTNTAIDSINVDAPCPASLDDSSINFDNPFYIYRNADDGKVYFNGGEGDVSYSTPILENDIRFTVKNTDEVIAWAERDEVTGFSVDAQLNGQAMTKTSVTGEDQFTATLPSVQPAELRLTMTRANVNDDVKITKILGGVA